MPIVLDCEDRASTLTSLSRCFNCKKQYLIDKLQSIDIEALYSDQRTMPEMSSEDYLLDYVVKAFGRPNKTTTVCWFHLTRTLANADFSNGIMPLSQALDMIWDTLFSIFAGTIVETRLRLMKENGVGDDQYNLKVNDTIHSGPYGILVLDTAFNSSDIGQHDYLAFPEIIEDICNGYMTKYTEHIYEPVSEALKPCVVKFYEYTVADIGALKTALYAGYQYANGMPVNGACIWCYDGNNHAVPSNNILSVRFIDQA